MADNKKKSGGFSDFELEAMRNRAKELKAEEKYKKNKELGEKDVLAAIDAMVEQDKIMAKRIHEIVKKAAPELMAKTWYGMPAYAKNDKVVCFFQPAQKFQARYSTLGFNDSAKLDDGNLWPTSFAIIKLSKEEEQRIIELVKKAVG